MSGSPCLLKGVSESATVGDLKKLIQQKSGDAPARQKLSNENGVTFGDDSCTLSAIGLEDGCCVVVFIQNPLPQIFLKNEKSQSRTFDMVSGETVSAFKTRVFSKEGIPEDQQTLVHNGKQLEDGKKIEHYGIGSGSTIYLNLHLRGGSFGHEADYY